MILWMKTLCSTWMSSSEWLSNGGDVVAIAGARGGSEEANGNDQERWGIAVEVMHTRRADE